MPKLKKKSAHEVCREKKEINRRKRENKLLKDISYRIGKGNDRNFYDESIKCAIKQEVESCCNVIDKECTNCNEEKEKNEHSFVFKEVVNSQKCEVEFNLKMREKKDLKKEWIRKMRQKPTINENVRREELHQNEEKRFRLEDLEYKEIEKVETRKSCRLKRKNLDFKERERVQQNKSKRLKRENFDFKVEEKLQQRESRRLKRQTPEYKEKERIQGRNLKRLKREDSEFKNDERVQQKSFKTIKREDSKFKEKERVQQRNSKRLKRKDSEFKEKEKIQQKESKRLKRKNLDFRMRESIKKTLVIKLKRIDSNYRKAEKISDIKNKRVKRKSSSFNKLEKERNKIVKRRARLNEFYRHRENFVKNLKCKNDSRSRAMLGFIKKRSNTPNNVCACCDTLWFDNSVINLMTSKLKSKLTETEFNDKIVYNKLANKICKTCDKNVRKGQIPKLAISNGLAFPVVPDCVKRLSDIEAVMVSPIIAFKQIRPLKPFALNPQLSLKGSVVYLPIEVSEVVSTLPRSFNDLDIIQVKLKRNVSHKSDYMNEVIKPAHVCEALSNLLNTPLYKKYNIKVDKSFFEKYEKNYDVNLDFIIENEDKEDQKNNLENRMLEDGDGDGKICYELESEPNNDSDNEDVSNEVLLLDRNAEVAKMTQILAPAQNKKPLPFTTPHVDALSNPRIFAGHHFTAEHLSYSSRFKSEARRSDRRSCEPKRILDMANQKLQKDLSAKVNVYMRLLKNNDKLTAKRVLLDGFIDDAIRHDVGYKVLKQLRLSPAYLEEEKKKIFAYIRQEGTPTLFFTLSAAERLWPELMKMLAKFLDNKVISIEEALNLDDNVKTDYIRRDPVACAMYFDYKFREMLKYLQNKNGPFEGYCVEGSYYRIEFQLRGSPHAHCFLWLKNAPVYDSNNMDSSEECIKFIDRFISCRYIENNPLIGVQRHKHTHTCNKGTKNKQKCRFDYPIPVMSRTMILEPLESEDDSVVDMAKKNFKEISKLMKYFFLKQSEFLSFVDILKKLNLTEDEYILSIRSSIKKTRVFLQRESNEVGINCYNLNILNLFEANMDIQFVLNAYGCASYIVNYISKVDAGLSNLLRQTLEDINNGNLNIKERLKKYCNAFLNGNLMSAQEAAYHVLSLVVAKCSRKVVFINTSPKNERARMLKSIQELKKLNPDSDDVFKDDHVTKYEKRSSSEENVCLADFVAFSKSKKKYDELEENDVSDVNDDSDVNNKNDSIERREKCMIIRFRRYNSVQDPFNYYREQVMLFLPWRCEEKDIIAKDCKVLYDEHIDIIRENRNKYCKLNEDLLNEAVEDVYDAMRNVNIEEIDSFNKCKLNADEDVDFFEQDKKEIIKDSVCNKYTAPPKVLDDELYKLMENLNIKQREFVMHILHHVKIIQQPFHIFLSGSAGVGKSTVINAVYQSVNSYFRNIPGNNDDMLRVLLCAPSGKAAFLIGGMTLHSAFKLPVSEYSGQMPNLSADVANTIRVELFHVNLLIIDEISMVGGRMLSQVDTRLRQIKGVNEPFGGVSVLAVGDLHQLPPVKDVSVFKNPKFTCTSELSFSVWNIFEFYELDEVMRQKNEKQLIKALNNLANKGMDEDDINLIKSRCVKESEVPVDAIRLYASNILVDNYNRIRIENHDEDKFESEANDYILADVPEKEKNYRLHSLKNKTLSELGGLPNKIIFKVGIKYMLTNNVDIQDGLVNGACGILRKITFDENTNKISKVWIEFSVSIVGKRARNKLKDYIKQNDISDVWTPISKQKNALNISKKIGYQVIREQFPIVAAEAITIHKSQGQTYTNVCLDLSKNQRITKTMLYVALSRTTELKGLYIIGSFKPPVQKRIDDPVHIEMNRLRKDKNLMLSYRNFSNFNGKIIVFQNCRSLKKHIHKIVVDQWYQKADVLIFAESRLNQNDEVEIPSFVEIFRSTNLKNTQLRGIIVFAKKNLMTKILKHVAYVENKGSSYVGQIDLICLQLESFVIVAGYKSPSVSFKIFGNYILDAINFSLQFNSSIVVIGDFNIDFNNESRSKIFKDLMSQCELKSVLPENTVTTDFETQIDVIFTNIMDYISGTYETYFSDHKPIYFGIPSNLSILCVNQSSHQNKIVQESETLVNIFDSLKIDEEEFINVNEVLSQELSNLDIQSYNVEKEIDFIDITNNLNDNDNEDLSFLLDIPDTTEMNIDEILNSDICLSSDHINQFGMLMNSQFNYDHQDVLYLQFPNRIKEIYKEKSNLQILYSGSLGAESSGHWILSYYHRFIINIYDSNEESVKNRKLTSQQQLFLDKMYPWKPKVKFHLVQNQTNGTNCGLFCMAFATSICFGDKPENIIYDENNLRLFARNIFLNKRIERFP